MDKWLKCKWRATCPQRTESSNEDNQLSCVVKTIPWKSNRLIKKKEKILDKT